MRCDYEAKQDTRMLGAFHSEVLVIKNLNYSTFYKNIPPLAECDEEYPCQGLGEHAHFRSFGMAFLTLFRIATGGSEL